MAKISKPNQLLISEIRKSLKSMSEKINALPDRITEEWIRERNLMLTEISIRKMKIQNLQSGRPELGYPDPIQTHGIPSKR